MESNPPAIASTIASSPAPRPDAVRFAGYRAWENLVHVRKGENGIFIRGPLLKKVVDEDTGEVRERLTGYIPLAVFDITQCVEYPEKQPPQPFTPATGQEWEHLYICWSRLLSTLYGIEVKEMDMGGLTYGMATQKSIRISNRHGFDIKAPVLLHELAHIGLGIPQLRSCKWTDRARAASRGSNVCAVRSWVGITQPADYLLNYRVEPGQLAEHLETMANRAGCTGDADFTHLAREVELRQIKKPPKTTGESLTRLPFY